MKGLLLKEWGLMKTQKVFFYIIAAMMIFALFGNDLSFALGYVSFAMPVFAITTISYDEFDNGYAFLFTLPVSRKQYVLEKYILGLILSGTAISVSCILSLIIGLFGEMQPSIDAIKSLPIIIEVTFIILSVMIPIQIKFGAEKGRNVMLLMTGMIVAIGFLAGKILNVSFVSSIINKLLQIDIAVLFIIFTAIVIACLCLSIKISICVINKKEF